MPVTIPRTVWRLSASLRKFEPGREFLLIPSTALWWLDHYKDFAAHLAGRYSIAAREERTCILYRLEDGAGHRVTDRFNIREHDSIARQVRAVVDSLLPSNAMVLVVSKGDPTLVEMGKRKALHFPKGDQGGPGCPPADGAAAIAELESLRAGGAQFLVMPKTASWWFDQYQEFAQHLETNYRLILRQKHVCHIYDLKGR